MDAFLQFLMGEFAVGGNDIPVLDANPSAHFPFLDCLQHSHKQLMMYF
jgi:hypothetical protein